MPYELENAEAEQETIHGWYGAVTLGADLCDESGALWISWVKARYDRDPTVRMEPVKKT